MAQTSLVYPEFGPFIGVRMSTIALPSCLAQAMEDREHGWYLEN